MGDGEGNDPRVQIEYGEREGTSFTQTCPILGILQNISILSPPGGAGFVRKWF